MQSILQAALCDRLYGPASRSFGEMLMSLQAGLRAPRERNQSAVDGNPAGVALGNGGEFQVGKKDSLP